MNKFVEIDGKVFMIVTPVKKLFHSTLVHSVITSGRKFAVNMNTGELTILTPKDDKSTKNNSNNV